LHDKAQNWRQRVEEALAPFVSRVPYGNLRVAFSDWDVNGDPALNLAMVYEVPGGSTNQINVTLSYGSGVFSYLSPDDGSEHTTGDIETVVAMLERVARGVPEERRRRLREDVERWFGEGRTHREMFLEINKLLQMDFKGGSITHHELKDGINYILELGKARSA
jgi:hypothetical protein